MGGEQAPTTILRCEIEEPKHSKERTEVTYEGKGTLSSHQVIFGLSNAITGPNLILLPLLFIQTGILASVILGVFFGYVAYKTCYLTVMHVKPTEAEYLFTVRRVLGKWPMIIYLVIVILDLWLVCVIFFISLVDTLYSGIQSIAPSLPDPSEGIIFHTFSIQWLAIILAVVQLICFCFKNISKIVSLSSKGEIGIIIGAFFLLYIGFKAIAQDKIHITFDTTESIGSLPLFSYSGLFTLIGFYSAAYLLHFMSIPILRTGADPSQKPRNLFLSYVITGLVYIVTGVFGALGLYWRIPPTESPQVIFGDYFTSNEKDVFVLAIITQIAVAFQLVTVIPVVNYIVKNQIFSYIWKQEEGKTVPDWAYHGYNIIMIIVMLGCVILNLSPNDLMNYVGTFGGFIIVYSVPVLVHLKSQRIYLSSRSAASSGVPMLEEERKMSIETGAHKGEEHIPPVRLNIFYLGIILLGIALVVVNICIAANIPPFA